MKELQHILSGLQQALQMEADGKRFYLEAARVSTNAAGKELFKSLAQEEDEHALHFKAIYDRLKTEQGWDDERPTSGARPGTRSIFITALRDLHTPPHAEQGEKEAVEKAMQLEEQSYELYRGRSLDAESDAEKQFYQRLMAEERGHFLVLNEYREFLEDPAIWFAFKEKPTLDGA